jgi:UPF0755 protein
MTVSRRPLLRAAAALVASALIIYLLSIVKAGPSAAADFDCSSDPSQRTVSIDVTAGETGLEIARELFEKDVIASSEVFFRLAVADPKAALIAPGIHMIETQICAQRALEQLLDNKRIAGLIAVSEGAWISEIKKLFGKADYSQEEIEKAFANAVVPKPFSELEGLIFPAQYSFAQGTSAASALKEMIARGFAEAGKSGFLSGESSYSPQQLLTIASIIQAEGVDDDFAKVSRVIYNRLKIGMPLQMDSTVHFVMKSRGNIFLSTKSTLINSPYNTYRKYGLPPGPIGNPGRNAMEAAMAPAAGDWLYFITVAPKDTRFTSSLDEFNTWKVLYKKNLRAGKFEGNQ